MHVLLLEDDLLIANGIIMGLEAQGFTVDHITRASMALNTLQQAQFDALILDLGLPDDDGLRVLQRIRQAELSLPVLVLTARDAIDDRVSGLQAGADDYMLKPFDLRELAARLHSLMRRSVGRSVNRIEYGALSLDPTSGDITLHDEPVTLTRRERALITQLLQHPSRTFTVDQLKDALYGYCDDVESNALNVHVFNLRRKLGGRLIVTVRGVGYRLGVAP